MVGHSDIYKHIKQQYKMIRKHQNFLNQLLFSKCLQ